jgi:ubiquinone/menaquinone biosynthesis C-methylase UbiE
MDSVVVEKVASASVFFENKKNTTLVDVGMASGTSTHILALLFPRCKVIGVDINPRMVEFAADKYKLPNLEFRVDDGETLKTFKGQKVHGFFNCSSIHHVTSFNGYDPQRAYNTLKRQIELLDPSGVLVVRDFAKPKSMEVVLSIPTSLRPQGEKLTDADLLVKFSKEARSLSPSIERGFPLEELKSISGQRHFKLWYADALEFIRRKDYRADYKVEIQEEYGYFTQAEFEAILADLGTRVLVSYPLFNPWIIKNRYEGNFSLASIDGSPLGIPPTNYLIAAGMAKDKGTFLKPIRQLPLAEKNFLNIKSYKNTTTGQVYDLAERPNPVIDLVPYFFEDKNVKILARYGYPRPLARPLFNHVTIDEKNYSGYIPETIAATTVNQPSASGIGLYLEEKLGIAGNAVIKSSLQLNYYTSPGGIDEKVNAFLVEINGGFIDNLPSTVGNSGFKDSGEIRVFDGVQLLKTAQVGTLAEARLELNVYHLLHELDISPGKWLGESISIEGMNDITQTNIGDVLSTDDDQLFVPSRETAGFLKHYRVKFYEQGVQNSHQILEYIMPSHLSHNTISLLPVSMVNGIYHVGIEKRYLPAPYLREGKSKIITVPAYRLPKNVVNYTGLKQYILALDFFGTSIRACFKLGEKYFPCVGLTPEQVYPYVVQLKEPTGKLYWVPLEQMIQQARDIKDGHLLVSLFRLYHALGWKGSRKSR